MQEFEAFTADLTVWRLAARVGVETGLESSVYWIPLFGVLEERDFQVMLVDPRRGQELLSRPVGCRPGSATTWRAYVAEIWRRCRWGAGGGRDHSS